VEQSDSRVAQTLGKPGVNPLFFGVLAGIGLGAYAGFQAPSEPSPATALHSNTVFRLEVGLAVALVSYWAAAALWLAWYRTLFRRLGIGQSALEPPETEPLKEERDIKVEETMAEIADALDALTTRVETLETRRDLQT
jgi:hypothetical protein